MFCVQVAYHPGSGTVTWDTQVKKATSEAQKSENSTFYKTCVLGAPGWSAFWFWIKTITDKRSEYPMCTPKCLLKSRSALDFTFFPFWDMQSVLATTPTCFAASCKLIFVIFTSERNAIY